MKRSGFIKHLIRAAFLFLLATINAWAQTTSDKMILVGGTKFEPASKIISSIKFIDIDEVKMIGAVKGNLVINGVKAIDRSGSFPSLKKYINKDDKEKVVYMEKSDGDFGYLYKVEYKYTLVDSTPKKMIADTTYILDYVVDDSMNVTRIDTIDVVVTWKEDIDAPYHSNDSTIEIVSATPIESKFLKNPRWTIARNPINLNSLNFIDDPTDNWGVAWGRFDGIDTLNTTILSYKLDNMAPNSPVKLVIKYRSILDPSSSKDLGCDSTGNQSVFFKVAANPTPANALFGVDAPEVKLGEEAIFVYDKANVDENGLFSFNVNIPSQFINTNCASLQITSIEVYGTLQPRITTTDGTIISSGSTTLLRSSGNLMGVTYQWYQDNVAVTGATDSKFSLKTSKEDKTYKILLKASYGSYTFDSNEITLKSITRNDSIADNFIKEIIYKEDFGEIDTTDHTGHTYKIWDYSDVSNPIQVTKTTTTPFRYELENAPLGCVFNESGPIQDGEYTVAGVLTGTNSIKGMSGAQLSWANCIGGKKDPYKDSPYYDLNFDHSGEIQGCALFINCTPNTGGLNIYERVITNLCKNQELFFECYFTVFTNNAHGLYNPVDITLRLTEIGNESNVIETRGTATIESEGGTGTWVKLSKSFFLEKGDAIKLEVVNNANVSENGNDLVIDDITISTYSIKKMDISFDSSLLSTETFSCGNSDNSIMIFVEPHSESLASIYGNDVKYLYQWTSTPLNKGSWKDIADPTTETEINVGTEPFEALEIGDKVYFRVVAGDDTTITQIKDRNLSTPCSASYTYSSPIVCTIKCPSCTNPAEKINIVANKKINKISNKKVIELCLNDKVTLYQKNNITPTPSYWDNKEFTGYYIKWFVDEKPGDMTDAETILNDFVEPITLVYNNTKLGGTEKSVILYAVDAMYPDSYCKTADTIFVKFIKSPNATFIEPYAEFTEGQGEGAVDLTLTEGTILDYTIHWWKGKDTLSGISLGDDKNRKFFEGLTAENSGTYSYQLVDLKTGCAGKIQNFEITIFSDSTSVFDYVATDDNGIVNVYSISGTLVKTNVKKHDALVGLKPGVYVIGRKKVEVK